MVESLARGVYGTAELVLSFLRGLRRTEVFAAAVAAPDVRGGVEVLRPL